MVGRKISLAGLLPLFVSGDPANHVHNWRYAVELLCDSLNDLDNTADFPGKADFFR